MKNKKNNLDPYTFGNSPAAINLVKILNETNYPSRFISASFTKFNRILNELEKIDFKISYSLATDLYRKTLTHGFITKVDNEILRTHLLNVLKMYYRVWIKKQKNKNK